MMFACTYSILNVSRCVPADTVRRRLPYRELVGGAVLVFVEVVMSAVGSRCSSCLYDHHD